MGHAGKPSPGMQGGDSGSQGPADRGPRSGRWGTSPPLCPCPEAPVRGPVAPAGTTAGIPGSPVPVGGLLAPGSRGEASRGLPGALPLCPFPPFPTRSLSRDGRSFASDGVQRVLPSPGNPTHRSPRSSRASLPLSLTRVVGRNRLSSFLQCLNSSRHESSLILHTCPAS